MTVPIPKLPRIIAWIEHSQLCFGTINSLSYELTARHTHVKGFHLKFKAYSWIWIDWERRVLSLFRLVRGRRQAVQVTLQTSIPRSMHNSMAWITQHLPFLQVSTSYWWSRLWKQEKKWSSEPSPIIPWKLGTWSRRRPITRSKWIWQQQSQSINF